MATALRDLDLSALEQARGHLYYDVADLVAERGEGVYLYDADGKRYLDCASATFNLSLGYSHPEIVQAIREQAGRLVHVTSSFQSEPVSQLVQRLIDVSPDNLTRVHPKVSSGSVANEGAIKMAQHATGKRDVITLFRSHLGQTMTMASLSGNAFRKDPLQAVYPDRLHVPDPYCARCFYNERPETCGFLCVERIDDFIEHASSGSVAAMVVEPISGNGGNIVPPHGYLQALKDLCESHQIVLVFDEVQTGLGRTGEMFAADYFGVAPHIMTVAKGLGGSGLQVAAILAEERLAGMASDHHSFTYGSNALACAGAAKTIEILQRPGFLEHVRAVGAYFMGRLGELQQRHPVMWDVRGAGLMIGIEVCRPEAAGHPYAPANVALTNQIVKVGKDLGLLLRTSRYGRGNVVKIRPPLIIGYDEADEVCDRLDWVLTEVEAV